MPGVRALLHFEWLFIEFSKVVARGTFSLSIVSVFLLAFLSLSAPPASAPPPGEIIGRNVGVIWQETVGDKTGIRWSHPGQLSPVHNFFPQLKKLSVASLMLIHMEPAEGGGRGIQ